MTRGGSLFVCSDHRSMARMCRFLRASSLAARDPRQVSCGVYFPGSIGMKSLIGRPKTHIAGDSFVSLSGVLRYCSIARWNASVLSSPFGPVLLVMSLFTVLTATSARQLLWAKATELRRWWTPQFIRN